MRIRQRGFTMVEILISLLIMGLAVSGLLDLLHWGQLRYEAITSAPRVRSAVGIIRRAIRSQVMNGHLSVALQDGVPQDLHQNLGTIRVASLSVRPYDEATMFVHAEFYDDRNGDGHQQTNEALPSAQWCFRTRGQGGQK